VRPAKLKEVKIRGYVTEFRSPTDFDIEDYRITRDEEFALDLENASPTVTFQLQDIRVGVELEIRGLLDPETGELKATAIKVDLEQFPKVVRTYTEFDGTRCTLPLLAESGRRGIRPLKRNHRHQIVTIKTVIGKSPSYNVARMRCGM
jgi:hypothetical protein